LLQRSVHTALIKEKSICKYTD